MHPSVPATITVPGGAEVAMYVEKVTKTKKVNGRSKKVTLWRARDRADGVIAYLGDSESEAKATAEDYNAQKRRTRGGLPAGTPKSLKKYTAREIVRDYTVNRRISKDELNTDEKELRKELKKELGNILEKEDLRGRICPKNAFDVLWKFSNRKEAEYNLFQFNRTIAQKYVDTRLTEDRSIYGSKSEPKQITPQTVYWEVARLRLVWKWAKKFYPDLSHLQNPWEDLEFPEGASSNPRDRELVGDELPRLVKACEDGCLGENKYYLPLGIYVATETGMRRQEFVDYLEWEDISFERRRIKIRKSKTDRKTRKKNQEIVLPARSQFLLQHLFFKLTVESGCAPTGEVFPMTGEAFSDAFDDAAIRAKIDDLQLRDLRQTATTMFIRAGLTPEERQVMKREEFKTMDGKHYQGEVSREQHLERIQDKLDRYTLGGKTLREVRGEVAGEFKQELQTLTDQGLSKEDIAAALLKKYPPGALRELAESAG